MSPQDYTIASEVSAGTATVLYHGLRNADERRVLIKVLKAEHATPEDVALLRHEYALTVGLDIPGAARAISLEEQGAGAALILEHAGGETIAELLRDNALTLTSALRVAADVARVLGALHRKGILHKQVRPQSILFDASSGHTTLIDFGLATRLHFEPQQARPPELTEDTLAYISPEQTARTNRRIDHRTDLYSLGVTLYEMLTGAPPFRSTSPMELVYSHIARRPTPAREVVPALPVVLSEIVDKLLSKSAEDRYNTGAGLAIDLEECLTRLERDGAIDAFPLGRWDQSSELRIPERLYGREREIEALFAAFDRVEAGAAEMLIVAGHSGVGKSALVQEVYKKIGQREGTLLSGKFDQLSRSAPYAPIARALREHVRHLLSEPEARLAAWRARCQAALGANAQLLVDLIPELGVILGEQPAVPPLGPIEAQSRFVMTFGSFLHLISADAGPLILFLDDLQWADSNSLRMLQHALCDPDTRRFLLVGAYRDNEVDEAHPVSLLVNELRKSKVPVARCDLSPLDIGHVTTLIADMLSLPEGQVAPLADAVFAKTTGVPLFLTQFLTWLAKDGLLALDAASRAWRWDLAAVKRSAASESVVDFLIKRLRQLDADAQRVIQLAACIGHRFDLETLSIIDERSAAETAAALWGAAQEGYVLPLDLEYRYFDVELRQDGAELAPRPPAVKNLTFRFLHDRIQQAAYALIQDGRERELHLRIGRLLLASKGPEPKDDDLFDVVNHLNVAADLIDDPDERTRLVRLNLASGRRAREAAAHEAAVQYFEAAAALVGDAGFEDQHHLAFEVHIELAECRYVLLGADEAEALLDTLLERAEDAIERARVENLRVVRYATLGRCTAALEAGKVALAYLGASLPLTEEEAQAALRAELTAIAENLAGRSIQSLASAPAATDPARLIEMRLLSSLQAPAYLTNPTFYIVIGLKIANLSLKYGNSDTSAAGYITYAWFLAVLVGKSDDAYEYGQTALSLNEKFKNAELSAKLHFLFGVIGFLLRPQAFVISHLEQAMRVGREVADLVSVSNAIIHLFYARFSIGESLSSLAEESERSLSMLRRTKDAQNELLILFTRQFVAALMGRTTERGLLSDATFDDAEALAGAEAAGFRFPACWYYLIRLRLAYLFEDYDGALRALAEAETRISSALGQQFSLELPFIGALTILAAYPKAGANEQRRLRSALESYEEKIEQWARQCPENFEHRRLLIAAERTRVFGSHEDAAELYDKAIEAARAGRFLPDEALSYELYARLWIHEGRGATARLCMQSAYHAYSRWGATAKLKQLREIHPDLVASAIEMRTSSPPPPVEDPTDRGPGSDVPSKPSPATILDVETVMQAAQTISSELVLDRLLDQLMRIVVRSAGAERGFLILPQDEGLFVEASITADPDVVRVRLGAPIEGNTELSSAIVQYVGRTREPVVLGDAGRSGAFPGDPYIASRKPKSILCVAMTHLGRLGGVFYFENNVTADAFSPVKVELCKLLATQAAIAVANAKLYQHVGQMTHELRQSNERLEDEVSRRTEQLRDTNARLEQELVTSAENEQLRAELQERIIRAQAERLDELSTPLIPIAEGVMVMPLIGTVDRRRAQQVLEASLGGAQANRARVVILDVTGAKSVDESFASTLVSAASALRLIGTQAVLTGIRPEVAQTLVALRAELQSIVTMSTLQSGVAYALRRSKRARA